LWFCTAEGLSRFDGYSFVNYRLEQGLPDRYVSDLLESSNGDYWVGTFRGLVHFNPNASGREPMFSTFALDAPEPQHINGLVGGQNRVVWVATNSGVFMLTKTSRGWTSRHVDFPSHNPAAGPLMEDRDGNLWVVIGESSLFRRRPDGVVERFNSRFFIENAIVSLFQDRDGRIWLGSYHGLALLVDRPRPHVPFIASIYGKAQGLLSDYVASVFQSSDGTLWVVSGGLYRIFSGHDTKHMRFELYGRVEQGFGPIFAEDMQGNLWLGTTRMARAGFFTYDRADGLVPDDVREILEGPDQQLYVITGTHSRFIHRFDGKRFNSVVPSFPEYNRERDWFWGWGQTHFPDRNGEWWVATVKGLFRYPPVKHLEDLAQTTPRIYGPRDGLATPYLFRLYQDSHGDIWIGAWGASGLMRWEQARDRIHQFTPAEGWLPTTPTAFAEDRSGSLWIGLWSHGLARFRSGRFTVFLQASGLPDSAVVVSLFLDHNGGLWAGTSRDGLLHLADPASDVPRFTAYTTRQGLSSNDVRAITEDHWGRIYFWTGLGVDRLEPATDRISHYTSADGLIHSGSDHQVAFCDHRGRLWFGFNGLSRLDPVGDPPNPPAPAIRITRLHIGGVAYPVSELGESNLSGVVLQPDQNHVEIDFSSLKFGLGEVLRYQYRLEGSGGDWSPLTEGRSVNYVRLPSGFYRFLVRAVNQEGVASSSPAILSFRVLAPVWQRWWFLSLVAATVILIAYQLHRYRLAHLLALERVRTRIASDLHDEIGSGLSQIAILTEVAKRDVHSDTSGTGELLDHVADVSRGLVDSMSEIVWAISPRRDSLDALTQRMRRFASDLLAPRNIAFDFRISHSAGDSHLGAEVRRHVFLIFKETINNSARHAFCTQVHASLTLDHDNLVLNVSDDGRGFEASLRDNGLEGGHGLLSMQRRATEIAGHLKVVTEPGGGTRIELRVPLRRRRFFLRRRSIAT
jgi:signal transduction histidine kinase/ligand-binding sensor domain-containing protein